MIENLCLVGVGSLGGHVAKHLQQNCGTIYAVDPDIVEEKNLRNSIYKKADIGKPKVEALKKHISNCRVIPVQNRIEHVEIPHVDKIIDCRDVTNRNIISDVKFDIIGKHLRVNCKPVVKEEDVPGDYLIDLSNRNLSKAGKLTARILMSNFIANIQQYGVMVHLPINVSPSKIKDIIHYGYSYGNDVYTLPESMYRSQKIHTAGGA